jgi:hypothetical protein
MRYRKYFCSVDVIFLREFSVSQVMIFNGTYIELSIISIISPRGQHTIAHVLFRHVPLSYSKSTALFSLLERLVSTLTSSLQQLILLAYTSQSAGQWPQPLQNCSKQTRTRNLGRERAEI